MDDLSDDELLAELGVEVKGQSASTHTPREERIIAGFEDILRFFDEHGHVPEHGEDRDIFERLYAVRLDRLRALDEAQTLLAPLDKHMRTRILAGLVLPAKDDMARVDGRRDQGFGSGGTGSEKLFG